MTILRRLSALSFATAAAMASSTAALAQDEPRKALKVCQDPNNLPFSNDKGEGIENRIAELFGKALGLPVEYYSFPNRLAFVRNTLRHRLPGEDYRCDVILGVPAGWGQVATTRPYYRSTYAVAFADGGPFDGVDSGSAFLAKLQALGDKAKVGLYDKSPASKWLADSGHEAAGVPFTMMSPRAEQYPGEILEQELVQGKVDAVVVWGPIAGYYARKIRQPRITVVPLESADGVKFDFEIAMGVRHGEPEWRAQIQRLIDDHREPIRAILQEYGVPLLPDAPPRQTQD